MRIHGRRNQLLLSALLVVRSLRHYVLQEIVHLSELPLFLVYLWVLLQRVLLVETILCVLGKDLLVQVVPLLVLQVLRDLIQILLSRVN